MSADETRYEEGLRRIEAVHEEIAMLLNKQEATEELLSGLRADLEKEEGVVPHTLASRILDFEKKIATYRTREELKEDEE